MDVSLILRVAGIGILVAVAAQILQKSGRDEQATLVVVSGIVVVFLLLVREIGTLFDTVREDDIIEELKNLELGNMTPIDALNTLYRMQTKLKNRWSGNEK